MELKHKIKNIIFDLGGVLIDLDKSRTMNCFGQKISTFYDKTQNQDFVNIAHSFERGEIRDYQFRKAVMDIFRLKMSAAKFDECWNAIIVGMPTDRIRMLIELREKYNLYVLSNTNEIHYDYFTRQDYWEPKLFEMTYFSHHLGVRKPEPEIYKVVLEENFLNPEETLFIDDTLENVTAAKILGINSILLKGEIVDLMNDLFGIKLPPLV